jgi:alcohol-forming fatty acyl-CoA reductase
MSEGEVYFLTGCTGFLGKVVLEKILRSLKYKKIYYLLRPKDGNRASQRFRSLLSSEIFECFRCQHVDFHSWIDDVLVPVYGDLERPSLGLPQEEFQMITNEITIIIHMAANTDFRASLQSSIKINVIGSMQVCLYTSYLM